MFSMVRFPPYSHAVRVSDRIAHIDLNIVAPGLTLSEYGAFFASLPSKDSEGGTVVIRHLNFAWHDMSALVSAPTISEISARLNGSIFMI